MDLNRRFPSIADCERATPRRIPHFAWEYLRSGIGAEAGLARNRTALDAVTFRPRYLSDGPRKAPELTTTLWGQGHAAPFGISPFGLSGLIWPGAARIAAVAAGKAGIPMAMSSFATTRMEEIRVCAGPRAWFQHYPIRDAAMQAEMLAEVAGAGFDTLVVTIDIPGPTRRDRDLRVGLSVPPRFGPDTVLAIMARPGWAIAAARNGIPKFVNLLPYAPKGMSPIEGGQYMAGQMDRAVSIESLRAIRKAWPGKLVIKGIMAPEDALAATRDAGADAIWVSNHGARQLDAARASVEVLAEIREALGGETPIFADSGVRSGLDIARMVARGADMVFLGRAFIFAIAAIGARGGDHAAHILRSELENTLGQIGADHPGALGAFLD